MPILDQDPYAHPAAVPLGQLTAPVTPEQVQPGEVLRSGDEVGS